MCKPYKDVISVSQGCSFFGGDWVPLSNVKTTLPKNPWKWKPKNNQYIQNHLFHLQAIFDALFLFMTADSRPDKCHIFPFAWLISYCSYVVFLYSMMSQTLFNTVISL